MTAYARSTDTQPQAAHNHQLIELVVEVSIIYRQDLTRSDDATVVIPHTCYRSLPASDSEC